MNEGEVLDNWTYCLRCLNILELEGEISRREIFDINNDLGTSRNMNNLLKFLEESGFIDVDKERVPYIYIIHKEKLARFLRGSVFFKKWGKVVEITKKFFNY